ADRVEHDGARGAQAQRAEGRIDDCAGAAQRGRAAGLSEAAGPEADIGQIGERLEGNRSGIDAVAELAERLGRPGAVVGLEPVEEPLERYVAAGRNVVPRVGDARTQRESAPLGAAVRADMIVVARSGGAAVLHVEARGAVAAERTHPPGLEHVAVSTD